MECVAHVTYSCTRICGQVKHYMYEMLKAHHIYCRVRDGQCTLFAGSCQALDHMHRNGIFHRDVKCHGPA